MTASISTAPSNGADGTPTSESAARPMSPIPTSFEVGVLNGGVKPGDTVAIVGAGPIGLAAVITAKLYTPAQIVVIDLDDGRLAKAKEFGGRRHHQ